MIIRMSGLRLRVVTPACFDHVGQQRQGQVMRFLHQHLGEVQVDARLEGHGQGIGAVVCSTATPCTSCPRRR